MRSSGLSPEETNVESRQINLLSAVLGLFWAVVFVFSGAIFVAGGALGRGAGEAIELLGLGFGAIALGVFVILAPLLLGTTLAALRRRWSVGLSLMVALISVLAPVLGPIDGPVPAPLELTARSAPLTPTLSPRGRGGAIECSLSHGIKRRITAYQSIEVLRVGCPSRSRSGRGRGLRSRGGCR